MSRPPVLVLRPQPGADETVVHLADHGVAAMARPVLETEALAESAELRACVQRLDQFDVIIFVSPAAVRWGLPLLEEHWPQYPLHLVWLAVGARTRELLLARDLPVLAPSDERTEGLLALPHLASGAADRVLIVRGEGGREALAAALVERGARVDHLVVYRRRPLAVILPSPAEISAVIATSSEVLDAFMASGGDRFAERPLLVPSPRVADHARAAGFLRVRIMAGADAEASRMALAELDIAGGGGNEGGRQ